MNTSPSIGHSCKWIDAFCCLGIPDLHLSIPIATSIHCFEAFLYLFFHMRTKLLPPSWIKLSSKCAKVSKIFLSFLNMFNLRTKRLTSIFFRLNHNSNLSINGVYHFHAYFIPFFILRFYFNNEWNNEHKNEHNFKHIKNQFQ